MNESIVKEVIKYVERGYTLKDTAKLLNVSYTTLARHILTNQIYRKQYYEAKAKTKKSKF